MDNSSSKGEGPDASGSRLLSRVVRFEGGGSAEAAIAPSNLELMGDRLVPKKIDVTFRSVDGQPRLALTLELRNGRPQCTRVLIESVEEGREVRPLDLRAVRLAETVEEIFAAFAMSFSDDDGARMIFYDGRAEAHSEAVQSVARARRGKGARNLDDAFLRKVAEVYRDHPQTPTKTVAEVFGVSHRMATTYVRMARDHGHLGPTTPGKKGG